MIIFKSITIKNFMSVGNVPLTFNYETGLTYVFGENKDVSETDDITLISNGAGKTVVLVDAPLFVLYGKTQRKIKKSEIVNVQNKTGCEAKLTLEKNGIEYVIERGISPDKILIYKNGVPESEESQKRRVNRIIEDEILEGISFEVFKNLIVLNGSTSKHFFEYGKSEKRTFINEVFRLGFLDYLQEQLTVELKEKKSELEKLELQKNMKFEEIGRMKQIIDHPEIEDKSNIETLNDMLKVETEKLNKAKSVVDEITRDQLCGNVESFKKKLEFASKRSSEANMLIHSTEVQINQLNVELDNLRNEYRHTVNLNECPKCTQSIDGTVKEKLHGILTFRADQIKSELEEKIKHKGKTEEQSKAMMSWIEAANKHILIYNEEVKTIGNSTLLINEYSRNLKPSTSTPKSKDVLMKEVETLDNQYKGFCELLETKQKEYNLHKISRDIVGGKNFYGHYISVFRDYLNNSINEYLAEMRSPHRIKFNNDLDADVVDGNITLSSYENLSTGEKSKINIALLLSFFDVLYNFHRMRTSLLVLDEVLDTGIDSVGVSTLNNILKNKVFNNKDLGIYVVSHKKPDIEIEDDCGINRVVFQRDQGFTTLKEK